MVRKWLKKNLRLTYQPEKRAKCDDSVEEIQFEYLLYM